MAKLQTLLLLEQEADRLENHFTQTGDKRFLHAARLLKGQTKRGRPAEKDEPLLFRMALLIRNRKCKTTWAAAVRVAKESSGQSTEATAGRLDRKFRMHGEYFTSNLSAYELRLAVEQTQRALKPLHDQFERIKNSPWYRELMDIQDKAAAIREKLGFDLQDKRRETLRLANPSSSK